MNKPYFISLNLACLIITGTYACAGTKEKDADDKPQGPPSAFTQLTGPTAPTPASPAGPGAAPGAPAGPGAPTAQPGLKVEIVNKDALQSVKNGEDVTVQFKVLGAPANQINVLCRAGRSEEFALVAPKACTGQGTHKIGAIEANATYSFSVEVMDATSHAKIAEETVNIRSAPGSMSLIVEGADPLRTQNTGRVSISVRPSQPTPNLALVCTIEGTKTPIPCADGRINLDLDTLQGRQTLNIKADGPQGEPFPPQTVMFCGGPQCSGAVQPAAKILSQFGLGAGYNILVPPTMHVLQYSTNRSFNANAVNIMEVLDDPFYNPPRCGNINVATGTDTINQGRIVPLANAAGQVYNYCQKTVPTLPGLATSNGQGPQLAFNSIEFSTEAATIGLRKYERFFFNNYEDNAQAVFLKSRFWSLCSHRFNGGVANMKVIPNWYGRVEDNVNVNYCQTQISGADGEVQEVLVAGFFFTKPDAIYPSTLEATYIMQPGVINFSYNTANYHRMVVGRMRDIIESTGLNEPFAGYTP